MRAAGIASPRREARFMYRALGRSAVEFLWLATRGDEAVCHTRIEASCAKLWQEAVGRGRGVVIAGSHTGNWDLAASAMARRVDLLVVTKRLRLEPLDRFWQGTRAARHIALAYPSGALGRGRRMLQCGGAVAMMIDQVPDSLMHAVETRFLGRAAFVDRAAAVLAARAGAPLVVAASRRDEAGEIVLHVLSVLTPPARPGRAWIDSATIAATASLDAFIRAYPSQWLWLHRRWKRPTAARFDRGSERTTLAVPCPIRSSSPAADSKVV